MVLPHIHTPTYPTTLSGINYLSQDGFSARDYATIAENWYIDDFLAQKGAQLSGRPLHLTRGQAAAQRRHPPVRVNPDGSKGKGKGK